MSHKCFISFKKEDKFYRDKILEKLGQKDVSVKFLDRWIDSEDSDYILQEIRDSYLADTTVTLFLIGEHSLEDDGEDVYGRDNNFFIKRELQASLFDGKGNTRSGIVGIVLPDMEDKVFVGDRVCAVCGNSHSTLIVDDRTVVREFSANYFIKPKPGCCWSAKDRYCVLVAYEKFMADPNKYINLAYEKRYSEISKKIRLRNLR